MGIQSVGALIDNLIQAYYFLRDAEAIISCVTDDIIWIGAEYSGSANDKESLRAMLKKDIKAYPEPHLFKVKETQIRNIGENAAIVTISGYQTAIPGKLREKNVCISMVAVNLGEGWLVCSIHASVPSLEKDKSSLEGKLNETWRNERLLLNSIPGGIAIYRIKKNGNIETDYISEGLAKLLGYADSTEMLERVGKNASADVPPEDMELFKRSCLDSRSSNEPISITFGIDTKDHHIIDFRMDANVISGAELGEDDEALVYAVHTIVTDEAKKISDEQRRYRTVFSLLGLAYWEWSEKNGYYSSERYSDYAISESSIFDGMTPADYSQYVHPDDLQMSNEYLEPPSEGEHLKSVVMRAKMKDGSYRWTEIYSLMEVGTDGKLKRIISILRDVDKEWVKQNHQREKLLEQTRRDPLTGLYNKEAFARMATDIICGNPGENHAIVFLDIDNFKELNDTLGHLTGDQALNDAAEKLRIIFSNYDLISRFGGDEFCIFVRNIPVDTLRGKLDWLIEKMKESYSLDGKSAILTCSCGVACTENCGSDFKTLMKNADSALYFSKNTGRNRYTFFSDVSR